MLNKPEFKNHLTNDLLPFWNNLYDSEYGGFYGSVNGFNQVDKKASKSAVLQSRILWFYSACCKSLRNENLLKFAGRQFEFIHKFIIDSGDGGIYWSVEYDGKIKDGRKHTYALAFALYSISAYYSVSKDEAALTSANKLFHLIENSFKDEYGYTEPYTFETTPFKKERTMNTLLHIMEAYTEYYQAVRSEEARGALEYSVSLVMNKAYNDNLSRIECYFDEFMNPVGDVLSYGHDIESSWLIYRACEVLGNDDITRNASPKLEKVAQNVISRGFADEGKGGVYYDRVCGAENKIRSWWVMAEAICALVHRYNLHGDGKSMLLAENLWDYVKTCFISPYGEWYSYAQHKDEPVKNSNVLCGAWKCPYHNGRMCLEILKTLEM